MLLMPIAFLLFGFAFLNGRSLSPSAVMRSVMSLLTNSLRWLWKERPERSGAGRIRQPRVTYRR